MLRAAIDGAPLIGNLTGVGFSTRGLVGALALRDDIRLDAFALSGRAAGRLRALLPAGVGHLGLPMPARPLLDIWSRFDAPVAERWTGPVDVVHGSNFVVPPTRHAAQVVTVHDLTSVRYPEMCTPVTLKYPALIRRAVQRGAHVHVLTEAIGAEVRFHFDVEPERVHVVPAGPPQMQHVPATASAVPYVLAIGTVEPRKDYPLLVRAFDELASEMPDVELWIAGKSGWGASRLENALAQISHRDRVRQLGWVDDEERSALLAGATALAYPSVYEGFGLPPLEAMQASVPVVATKIDAVAEVCGDAALLVPPGDVSALATGLKQVIADSAERERLVEAGHKRVSELSWDAMAAGLVDTYRIAAAAS